jgi:hypothetical protein
MRTITRVPSLHRGFAKMSWLLGVLLLGLAAAAYGNASVTGRVGDSVGSGVAGVTVSLGAGLSGVTDESGDYLIADVPEGDYGAVAAAPGYVFLPTVRTVVVPDTAVDVSFTATALGTGIPLPGASAIYLAGRDDVTIPALGADPGAFPFERVCGGGSLDCVREHFPAQFAVTAGAQFQFAAWGGVAYYGGWTYVAGPDGYSDFPSSVGAMGGISAYNGPAGALVGVFLDDLNPGGAAAAEALDFSAAGLGTNFALLAPDLGQVFFIGDGHDSAATAQTFTAPQGATRLFIGTADAGNFSGTPGAYDDNQGSFVVDVQRLGYTLSGTVTGAEGALAGVMVSVGGGLADVTNANGAYTIAGVPPGDHTITPSLANYIFMPPRRLLSVTDDTTGLDFTAYATAGRTLIPGSTAIFLAGRIDVVIPDLGVDPGPIGFPLGRNCTAPPTEGFVKEVVPPEVAVSGGEVLTFAASGAVDYYGGTSPATGPDGDPGAVGTIDSLSRISGYQGPNGALVGVFLDNNNPGAAGEPPPTLDFTASGVTPWFRALAPQLRQVFFIGNGTTESDGRAVVPQEFTVPAGATRLCIGIADAFGFGGAPGAYDDNIGAFVVGVTHVAAPAAQTIDFPALPQKTYGDAPFALTATASSGMTVSFASDRPSVATVNGGTVTLRGAGSCIITATQAGNAAWNAAPAVPRTLTVARAALSVTANPATRPYGVPNPAFSGTLRGVVAGDRITAIYASAAVPTTPTGVYGPATAEAIIPILLDPDTRLTNYTVSVTNGTLTIREPNAIPPNGTFVARVDTTGAVTGRGLWDLSGSYAAVAVAGQDLTLHLVHDTKGGLGGTATLNVDTGTEVVPVPMPVRGRVKGSGGALVAHVVVQGRNAAKGVSVTLRLDLSLDPAERHLRGPVSGSIKIGAGSGVPVSGITTLAIPAPMDGTWTLTFVLNQNGRSVRGAALLLLSNSAAYSYRVAGSLMGQTAVLNLAGEPHTPPGKAIKMSATVATVEGNRALIRAFSCRGYGLALDW